MPLAWWHMTIQIRPGKEDFDVLAPAVDAFSLMTYDYSNPSR